jgi:hypothetical protein
MKRGMLGLAAALSIWAFGSAGVCRGQGIYVRPQTNPYNQPAVSPYLNLNRGGNPAVNYYGLVRPLNEINTSIQQLQQQSLTGHGVLTPEEAALVPATGHPVQFFNHSHYYPVQGIGFGSLDHPTVLSGSGVVTSTARPQPVNLVPPRPGP